MKLKWILFLILLACCSILIALPVAAITNEDALLSTSTTGDDYIASFSWDGKVNETFHYHVKSSDNFTMLYRNFNVPLVTKNIQDPHIEFLGIDAPEGTITYLKDNSGLVSFPNGISDADIVSNIKSKSFENEVGIYREQGFEPGTYPVVYNFRFYPPIQYDESVAHLNILLLQTHSAYNRIQIIVPEKSVRKIYFSPSHLTVTKNNNTITASGSLAENEDLGFEVILEKETLETLTGYPNYTENITSRTEVAYDVDTNDPQTAPVVTQPPTELSSGNWFIDWFTNLLHPITNRFQQNSPLPTYQPGIYRVPTIPPYQPTIAPRFNYPPVYKQYIPPIPTVRRY